MRNIYPLGDIHKGWALPFRGESDWLVDEME